MTQRHEHELAPWTRSAALAVGLVIRRRRLELGLTQQELAARLGIDRAIYTRRESGKHLLSLATVYRVAAALETSPTRLLEPLNVLQQWVPMGRAT